jgi:hypothetical protein
MRSPTRWVVVLLVGAAMLLATRMIVRPYVRATSLIVRTAGLERRHPALAAIETDVVAQQSVRVPSLFGQLRAMSSTRFAV